MKCVGETVGCHDFEGKVGDVTEGVAKFGVARDENVEVGACGAVLGIMSVGLLDFAVVSLGAFRSR